LSHIFVLIGVALLILLWRGRNAQRVIGRVETVEPDPDIYVERADPPESPALPWEMRAPATEAAPDIAQPSVAVTAQPSAPARRHYLLDGFDTPRGRSDPTAQIERSIRGRGICSPRP
jgi:hypothetical protein